MGDETEQLRQVAAKFGIGNYRRHVLLCLGPSCCDPEAGERAWDALKSAMKDAGLVAPQGDCYRTKVGCLRVCQAGPVLVVYPDGTWYRDMTADRIPRFVREHLVEGRPVEAWVFARNPLPAAGD